MSIVNDHTQPKADAVTISSDEDSLVLPKATIHKKKCLHISSSSNLQQCQVSRCNEQNSSYRLLLGDEICTPLLCYEIDGILPLCFL